MNSTERHQRRYERRKAKRDQHKMQVMAEHSTDVFSFSHLIKSGKRCCLGVGWKRSTQLFRSNFMLNIYQIWKAIQENRFKSRGFYEFDIYERGKMRHIKSVHISERVIQKCLSDYFLIPLLEPHMIYDNGASMKGKGNTFSVRRLVCHLNRHFRKYGTDGYIVLYDFHDYFNSLDHEEVMRQYERYLPRGQALDMAKQLMDESGDHVGLGLGSQVNQVTAVGFCNAIDHYFKDVCQVQGYGRYMDDGYIMCRTKEEAEGYAQDLLRMAEDLKLTINPKKLHIQRINDQFVWLKNRIRLLPSGHVLRRLVPRNVTVERRKLKTIRKNIDAGKFHPDAGRINWASWTGYTQRFDCHRTYEKMKRLYEALFEEKERK